MKNPINSDLIRGHIDTIILKALYEGDRYGYDIIKEIEEKSTGEYKIKQATLYSSLRRLEEQGFTSSYWENSSVFGGRKKYYTLTDMGKEVFAKNQNDWQKSRIIIDRLMLDAKEELGSENSSAQVPKAVAMPQNRADEQAVKSELRTDEQAVKSEAKKIDELPFLPEIEVAPTDTATSKDNTNGLLLDNLTDSEPAFNFLPQDLKGQDDKESGDKHSGAFSDSNYNNYSKSRAADILSEEAFAEMFYNEKQEKSYIEDAIAKPYTPAKIPKATPYQTDEIPFEQLNRVIAEAEGKHQGAAAVSQPKSRLESLLQELKGTPEQTPKAVPQSKPMHKQSKEEINKEQDGDYMFLQDDERDTSVSAHKKEGSVQFFKYNGPESVREKELTDEEIVSQGYQSALSALVKNVKRPDPSNAVNIKTQQEKKLVNITQDVKDMGDEVVVRRHDNTVKQYNTENYFYRNRLMLVHYGILFVFMLVQIAALFVINEIFLHKGKIVRLDLYLYIAGVLIALILPAIAFAFSYKDYNKRKQKEQSFRPLILFRIIVVLQLLVIIGAVNVFTGILTGNFLDYLAAFVMPSILSLNVFWSLLIYYLLQRSGRFNV